MAAPSSAGSWRGGGGGGGGRAPAAPAPPAAGTTAPEPPTAPEEEPTQFKRTIDLYWQKEPQDKKKVWISKREFKQVVESRMPVVLEKLKPDSVFDPRDAWSANKKAAEEARIAESANSTASTSKKEKKEKKLSKKEQIMMKNAADKNLSAVEADNEKLNNALKEAKKGSEAALKRFKPQTPLGKLRHLLMILDFAITGSNFPEAFDVLWAIEMTPLFLTAQAELDNRKEQQKKSKDDKKKSKDKDGKKDKKSKEAKEAPLSPEAELCYQFKKEIKKARQFRSDQNMVEFQLCEMHDRLPPLSQYNRSFKLDDWQCKVLNMVDQEVSAIVCAPTSSGKTVISTYAVVKAAQAGGNREGGGVLFVVPTEPLVWQVAAMVTRLMPGKVSLCTNQFVYRPKSAVLQSDVVVGTPSALESSLTKIRGLVGAEVLGKNDYSQMIGGFNFRYAVFDEVHAIDGPEGGALQRLMRLVECPFLALSATIGNAESLQGFWHTVRQQHIDVIDANEVENIETGELITPTPEVELTRHEGRFINLQRLIIQDGNLVPLHPCAAVTTELLQTNTFDSLSLSFTPKDAYALWGYFAKHFDRDSVADLDPVTFFAALADDGAAAVSKSVPQITLEQSKMYEKALKERLETFARDAEKRSLVDDLLAEFVPGAIDPDVDLLSLGGLLKADGLFPCLCFQLDTFKCVKLFKDLLGALEEGQATKFPKYYEELEEKHRKKMEEIAALDKLNDKDKEEAMKEGADLNAFVDTAAPHPDFILSPPNSTISTVEFDDILAELKKDGEPLMKTHPFARGLRRGIAIYIDVIALPGYRRKVQQLAQQGKLAMVFSDHSLAYGVNMPFRTCTFCGDMGELMTPLMAQQMAGRSGRRGLDTQGNLVYAGMSFTEIQNLMLGRIPNIEGTGSQYPLMAISGLSKEVNARKLRNACRMGFDTFQAAVADGQDPLAVDATGAFYDTSVELCQTLGLLDEELEPSVPFTSLTLMFEMRTSMPEILVAAKLLPKFLSEFTRPHLNGRENEDFAGKENVQIDFFLALVRIIDRVPAPEGVTPLGDMSYMDKDDRRAKWNEWEASIQATQDELDAVPDELKSRLENAGGIESLKLAVPVGAPLDSRLFEALMSNRMPSDLDSIFKHELNERITAVGNFLIKMSNCLSQPGDYVKLAPLLRKCFSRIKYMLDDSVKDETSLADRSGVQNLAAAAEEEEDAEEKQELPPGAAAEPGNV